MFIKKIISSFFDKPDKNKQSISFAGAPSRWYPPRKKTDYPLLSGELWNYFKNNEANISYLVDFSERITNKLISKRNITVGFNNLFIEESLNIDGYDFPFLVCSHTHQQEKYFNDNIFDRNQKNRIKTVGAFYILSKRKDDSWEYTYKNHELSIDDIKNKIAKKKIKILIVLNENQFRSLDFLSHTIFHELLHMYFLISLRKNELKQSFSKVNIPEYAKIEKKLALEEYMVHFYELSMQIYKRSVTNLEIRAKIEIMHKYKDNFFTFSHEIGNDELYNIFITLADIWEKAIPSTFVKELNEYLLNIDIKDFDELIK